jgi:hypothetical protein
METSIGLLEDGFDFRHCFLERDAFARLHRRPCAGDGGVERRAFGLVEIIEPIVDETAAPIALPTCLRFDSSEDRHYLRNRALN